MSLAGCTLVTAVLAFSHLGARPLISPAEARYALVAREMAESGDWIQPRFNHVRFYEKPPLTYWCVGTAYRALGFTEGRVAPAERPGLRRNDRPRPPARSGVARRRDGSPGRADLCHFARAVSLRTLSLYRHASGLLPEPLTPRIGEGHPATGLAMGSRALCPRGRARRTDQGDDRPALSVGHGRSLRAPDRRQELRPEPSSGSLPRDRRSRRAALARRAGAAGSGVPALLPGSRTVRAVPEPALPRQLRGSLGARVLGLDGSVAVSLDSVLAPRVLPARGKRGVAGSHCRGSGSA